MVAQIQMAILVPSACLVLMGFLLMGPLLRLSVLENLRLGLLSLLL